MRYILLAGLAASAAVRVSATEEAPSFQSESFKWRAEITHQRRVEATNPWGDLRVRTADHDELLISGMVQKTATTDEFEIDVRQSADGVRIEVRNLAAAPRGRVDLTLLVPSGMLLNASTDHGLAEIRYQGEADIHTTDGRIFVKVYDQAVRAESVSGSITARLPDGALAEALSVASETGNIDIWMPEQANLELRIQAGGRLSSEIALEEADPGSSAIQMKMGQGGPKLRVRSGSGDVSIGRRIVENVADVRRVGMLLAAD